MLAMNILRTGNKLLTGLKQAERVVGSGRSSKGVVELSIGSATKRNVSAQPLPVEEAFPEEAAAELASFSGRTESQQAVEKAEHERLIYAMFQLRAKQFDGQDRDQMSMALTPIRVLMDEAADSAVARKWRRQVESEYKAHTQMHDRLKEEHLKMKKRGVLAHLSPAQRIMQQWFNPLVQTIQAEQEAIMSGTQGKDRRAYGPFLLYLPPTELAAITLHGAISCLLQSQHAGQAPIVRPSLEIGKNVLLHKEMKDWAAMVAKRNKETKQLRRVLRAAERMLPEDEEEMHLTAEQKQAFLKKLSSIDVDLPAHPEAWKKELQDRVQKLEVTKTNNKQRQKKLLAKQREWLSTDKASQIGLDHIAKAGIRLLEILKDTAKIVVPQRDPYGRIIGPGEEVPAFSHYLSQKAHRKVGMFQCHDEVVKKLNSGQQLRELLVPNYMPMLVPPIPWRDYKSGGYLIKKCLVMRTRKNRLQKQALAQADRLAPNGLERVYSALNALGETSWRINTTILAVVEEAYRQSLDIGGLPSQVELPMMPKPTAMRFRTVHSGYHRAVPADEGTSASAIASELVESSAPLLDAAADPMQVEAADHWIQAVVSPLRKKPPKATKGNRSPLIVTQLLVTATSDETMTENMLRRYHNVNVRKSNREEHALRCDMQYKLQVAQEFAHEDAIYFPHNLDFRGRAYPMHPHLNHLGNDFCRGVLHFAEARPLGPHGLEWLYVQIANSFGQGADKLNFEGRRQFARDNLENIRDSANNPLGGKRWWTGADDPWQCLAACMEIRDALASHDVTTFMSRLPLQMDGSCNGLQHYAALGRDAPGGRAVNLTEVSAPQDVYTEIANLVRERVSRDAAEGSQLAQMLLGEVDRKLVKQTVMTSVYGVTFVGARGQISNRLRERGWSRDARAYKAAFYGAQVTLDSLHKMFGSAKDIMTWLAECAKAIAKEDQPVMWTTPLGLPVVQPYRKLVKQHVNTTLQRLVMISASSQRQPVQKARQRSAFPPNFIHSIDSTHMMMTATACKEHGLAFAGVHDSFWTHAGSVDTMNRILRDKFVELHQQPILENLLQQLQEQYPAIKFPEVPMLGDLDINEVRKASYFFS